MRVMKRKTEMSAEKRRMIESIRGTSCEICKGEKKPVVGLCNRCLNRLTEDERRILEGSPFDPRYQPTWYRAVNGTSAPVPPNRRAA